jgi:hypothetical protein
MRSLKLQFKISKLLHFAFPFCILVFTFCVFDSAIAAVLYFSPDKGNYNVNDVFKVDLMLDTEKKSVNAGEITVLFDPQKLSLEDISKGNSVFTIWVKQIEYSNEAGKIYILGGVPDGFSGDNKIISIFFRATESGKAAISASGDSKILLNDGFGTSAKITGQAAEINIKEQQDTLASGSAVNQWRDELEKDNTAPNHFTVKIERNSSMFDGKYFIVFSATDGQSGIDYYEIKEGNSDWKIGESPYLLSDQNLTQEIYVRAVDKAGNQRTEKINNRGEYILRIILVIICGVVLFALFRLFSQKRKIGKKQND